MNIFEGVHMDDNGSVMASANANRYAAESSEEWSTRVQYARETEDAAKDFVAARSERTAVILLGSAINSLRESDDKSLALGHLMSVAAAHLASTGHAMAAGMAKVPPLGWSVADGQAAMSAILQVWDAWMATQADPERSAEDLRAMDELEVREL